MRMVRSGHPEAIDLARQAQAVASTLGLTEVLSDALNTEACSVNATGGEWAGTMHRALDTGLAGQHEIQIGRAYVNLYATYVAERNFAASEPYYTAGLATATTTT